MQGSRYMPSMATPTPDWVARLPPAGVRGKGVHLGVKDGAPIHSSVVDEVGGGDGAHTPRPEQGPPAACRLVGL